MRVIDYLLSNVAFWTAWIIIPIVVEIIPAMGNVLILLKKSRKQKHRPTECFYSEITLIIPVYNSAGTLRECIKSINDSNYPKELIQIILINNQGKDNSFEVFQQTQKEFKELRMNWMNSKQGKSRALNLALYNSTGKYIIHIDSDGILHSDAIKNIVMMFETEPDTHCITGTILTNPKMIDETKQFFRRFYLKIEFFEYCQAFLAGRNYESESNNIFTLSGAFSAFRRSTILKTQLYNTDTVCEDTHVTFQVRDVLKKSVKLCPLAFFYVDPIEDINRLYTQRQRWQRGEMEVAHIFLADKLSAKEVFLGNFAVRLLMFDHTFAFPRMIWSFILIFLVFLNYPIKLVIISTVLVFALYILSTFLYYVTICIFLRPYKDIQRYYMRKWYIVLCLPFFNFFVFWFRFAGIINAIKGKQTWRTRDLTEEKEAFTSMIKKDFSVVKEWINKVKRMVNVDDQ